MVIKDTEIKIIGYMCLQYGKEYLKESLTSVKDYVDKFYVMYTPVGSQGNRTNIECPENKEELFEICSTVLGDKMVWHENTYSTEGEHRSEIYKFSDGYDLVLTLDADEVLEEKDIQQALLLAYKTDKRYIGINGFINFWRSFSWYCKDFYQPIRITNLHNPENTQGDVDMRIYHFSCAQSEKTIRYKWNVSGHTSELRPNWVDDILYAWTPQNMTSFLHPVALDIWRFALPFDKESLPQILKEHTNFTKDII